MMEASAGKQKHFIVATVGTTGDVYPFISLAQALQKRGHRVTMRCPEMHEDMVRQAGIAFHSSGDKQLYLDAIKNPDLWDAKKGFAVIWRGGRSKLHDLRKFVAALDADEECILLVHPFAVAAADLARAARPTLPVVAAYLAPSNLRTCHDPLVIGPMRIPRWFPMAWRQWIWNRVDASIIDPVAVPDLNLERQSLGLPPIEHYLEHMYSAPTLSVTLFPSWFAPRPPDWPSPMISGDFQLFEPALMADHVPPQPDADANANANANAALVNFLAAGERPIVFTPGTGHCHASDYFAAALVAVQQLGRRAIFLTAHQDQVPATLPASVLWQKYAAFQVLLPQVAALVHHGGIGTTAEALRAGVAQLVVPFAHDQFDNAERIRALGVGDTIKATRLRAGKLATMLERILTSDTVRTQCAAIAARFGTRQDADALCAEIELALGLDSASMPRANGSAAGRRTTIR